MLVYPLPPDNNFVWSLRDVSCSKRSYDLNEKIRSRFYELRRAGRKVKWPPKDDPYCDYKLGWLVPGFQPGPHDEELGKWTQRFCAHRLGVHLLHAPLLTDCLAYIYDQYVRQYGSKEWIKVEGERSYKQRTMKPQDQHLKEINGVLKRLFSGLNGEPVNGSLILKVDEYDLEDIRKTYEFCLPWIVKWTLHSYLTFPEEWASGTGQYERASLFKREIIKTSAVKIDVMAPHILAAMQEKPQVEKKKPPKKELEQDEGKHWLDDPDHSLKLRHGEF